MSAAESVSASFSQAAPPTSPLAAAVLPASRSATVNNPVTAFATIINSGGSTAPPARSPRQAACRSLRLPDH
jgi:hypothetical protein